MHVEGGDKLSGRVREGRWLGVDEKSKGSRVYWPDKMTVSVERNVYFDESAVLTSRHEGEEGEMITPKVNTLENLTAPTPAATVAPPAPPRIPMPPLVPQPAPEEPPTMKRIRKPSQHILNLIEGRGTTSNHPSDPIVTHGIQAPTPAPPIVKEQLNIVLEGEGQADWMMSIDFPYEYALVAETSEFEAIEPRNLAKARRRPDWPMWEKGIYEVLKTL